MSNRKNAQDQALSAALKILSRDSGTVCVPRELEKIDETMKIYASGAFAMEKRTRALLLHLAVNSENDRKSIANLQEKVNNLNREIESLKTQFKTDAT